MSSALIAGAGYAAPVTIDTFQTPTPAVIFTSGSIPVNREDNGLGIFGIRTLTTLFAVDIMVIGQEIFLQINTSPDYS
jgi:hypothetical protein